MLTYTQLKENPRRFLSVTSLTVAEFESLVPVFAEAYEATQSSTHTRAGTLRQRRPGGGQKTRLVTIEDKLLFILMYHKTYPIQTVHGLQFGLSQSHTNEWIHRLMPILQKTLAQLHYAPERDPVAFKLSGATTDPVTSLMLDGTERRRQRSKDPKKQQENYSGKKKPIRIKT